jgi:hypothetical protein
MCVYTYIHTYIHIYIYIYTYIHTYVYMLVNIVYMSGIHALHAELSCTYSSDVTIHIQRACP